MEDDETEIDYDSDGYPIIPERSKVIDPLPPVDHSAVRDSRGEKRSGEREGRVSRGGRGKVKRGEGVCGQK